MQIQKIEMVKRWLNFHVVAAISESCLLSFLPGSSPEY